MKLSIYLLISTLLHVAVIASVQNATVLSPSSDIVSGDVELLHVSMLVVQPEKPTSVRKKLTRVKPLKSKETVVKQVISEPETEPELIEQEPGARWVTPVEYKQNPAPVYPRFSRLRGQQGVVVLQVQVDEAGKSNAVGIHSSSGFSLLDNSAKRAVANWQFVPAKQGDISIASEVLIPIKFELKTRS